MSSSLPAYPGPPFTPSQAYEHVKESVVQYLETAYRITHPAIVAERGAMLRAVGAVAQTPFIEATPAFPTARKLVELERLLPDRIPAGIAELVRHGVPVDRFPLYAHQEAALLAATGERPNLLVATGTGSGKTEAFLLPIFADILREGVNWPAPRGPVRAGEYDAATKGWRSARRHETRPAAMRAIILYPMNALVNDQLARLRRILAGVESADWQRAALNDNVIHFAMYTGLSRPTGSPVEKWRRDDFAKYLTAIEADWQSLAEHLRKTGNWPRPHSPEMLCRWDMQQAPPDILVTNYSMLEYMLIRPIEAAIFDETARWLAAREANRITLVLDEAHTYTGAKGTEVAHLIRRLKERLGLAPDSGQFRAIATSASIPDEPDAQDRIRAFASGLFGVPPASFSFITLAAQSAPPARTPSHRALSAYARFHERFTVQEPLPAIRQLAAALDLGEVDDTADPQVALYRLIEGDRDIAWLRTRTARRATPLDLLARECWEALGTAAERERATAGLLAAGSFARATANADTPPLLSMRVHAFFRGLQGLWACLDPRCPSLPLEHAGTADRPVGKLYADPRPWCDCGARVLELFSCRKCGLLFLGGIPDTTQGSLWPWSDDLSGDRQSAGDFQVFGVEQPFPDALPDHRSVRTTRPTHRNDNYARAVYEVDPATDRGSGAVISPYPEQCPRCQNYRAPKALGEGREIVEDLRTKGPRTFSVIVEDGFRVQPRAEHGLPPNHGRKALLFTDSRLEAAQLAADLRHDHSHDLFRQIAYRSLHICRTCGGRGSVELTTEDLIGQPPTVVTEQCRDCAGSGRNPAPAPLSYQALRSAVINLQLDRDINPTEGNVTNYFERVEAGAPDWERNPILAFDLALRRELSEDEFSLEPLGLATWRVKLPERTGALPELTEAETQALLRAAARILATENILLPPEPLAPWDWPHDLVEEHDRKVIVWGSRTTDRYTVYNLSNRRKLGRYVIALAQALVAAQRLPDSTAAETWVAGMVAPLWEALTRKTWSPLRTAGPRIDGQQPFGIRIDAWELAPIGETIDRCTGCAVVLSETLLGVCIRCGQQALSVAAADLGNFYRRAALHAAPGSLFDDPYPLVAIEHTAQIPGYEARDIERWFQDLFREDENARDRRVDILSVTTTMEMGIDIGSLLSVGLRNVPPTVANYQQRSGRAGRRGSSIATVFTFAQQRSHDQYYFSHPPAIVSDPPRVPTLFLVNEEIAHRHVRSLILQAFFEQFQAGVRHTGLFAAWGTAADFVSRQGAQQLALFLATQGDALLARAGAVVAPSLVAGLPGWVSALHGEVVSVVNTAQDKDELLQALIRAGLLPKYAFPVDTVSLSIPSVQETWRREETPDTDAMQRDIQVALAEYAPGAEVLRGTFPNTYIYRSAGVYDPFAKQPDYRASGAVVLCNVCQSLDLLDPGDVAPLVCAECGDLDIFELPYLRPAGFTVDAALPNGDRQKYSGGGRDRAGFVSPARLRVGASSFEIGAPCTSVAPRLFATVRQGQLFTGNMGPDSRFPGFSLCPDCGRALAGEDALLPHTYPASVPPHYGRKGPRAGDPCPNSSDGNQLILGAPFYSQVILLGAELPPELDAPYAKEEASGRAVWHSFGSLVANAAARELQIDPGELRVGVRPAHRGEGRTHGEVFIYDNVPGGAGYASAIHEHLAVVLRRARALGRNCTNAACAGACYSCLLEYGNQRLHPLLDRALGAAMLAFLLDGELPTVTASDAQAAADALAQFARADWAVRDGVTVEGQHLPLVLESAAGDRIGLWVIHPLQARPAAAARQAVARHGIRAAVHTTFDLERRPFWVLNNLVRP